VHVKGIVVVLSPGGSKAINLVYTSENLKQFIELCLTYTETEVHEHTDQKRKGKDRMQDACVGGL
jgi:hypothetical protein